ncbi:MAG: outer membrane protein transport protein, partial [Deltaproteobacteria bacterium]|nr:outer membrane protein transport protein [Deltaproteobacteria bacterium]
MKAPASGALAAFIAAAMAVGGAASPAMAEGFAIYDYGARGSALGGAMVARNPDPSAVAHNAALLTRLPGTRVMAGFTVIATRGDVRWGSRGQGGVTHTKKAAYLIPHAYFTKQLSERWFLGVGEFSRFGLGNKYPDDWPGRYNVYDIYLLSASLNPTIAFRATDRLSLGAGIELVYASLDMKNRIPFAPPAADVDVRIKKAEDIGVGFNLALHYEFSRKWSAGLQYRSPVRIKAEGRADFTYVGPPDQFLEQAFAATFRDGTVKGVVTLPESLSLGVSYSPAESLTLEGGVVWTRWSRYRTLELTLPDPLPVSKSPKRWKDTWRFTFGAEYAAADWLDLRLGYNFTQSPMTGDYADYTVPTRDRHTFTAGAGISSGGFSLDLALLYVLCNSRGYSDSPAPGGTGTVDSRSEGFRALEAALSL